MNVFLMADYRVGWQVATYLKAQQENVVGLAIHPPEFEHELNRGYTKKIIDTFRLPAHQIFAAKTIHQPENLERIKALKPDVILTVLWGFLLKPEFIAIPPKSCINFHAAYLPYNRGHNPNVWSIIDATPAGVTLHYINPGIDSGDIIAQRIVPIESTDTGATLYAKLMESFMPLFKETWPKIKTDTAPRQKQDESAATIHYGKNFASLNQIDLEKKYTAAELINLLRSRTFRPFPAAYFMENGKKVYVRVQLEYGPDDQV